ncbi:tyrosine-type recombinase/integrase [Hanstruepera marina]|uniref:tyrosine-type recombinase/integrase n=1 Tax=Hanstruepera marina TaxID=2873265 RepID=UPI001CA60188|nr:site-specific integrase [Hanstruepera marina]
MFTLNDYLADEHGIEHDLEHNLLKKKNFSSPKIYNANGNLSRRWYVYFSFRNPQTGKLQRMKNIYGTANNYDSKEDRLAVLTVYRNKLKQLLKEGFNPFEDNSKLIEKRNQKSSDEKVEEFISSDSIEEPKGSIDVAEPSISIQDAFSRGLKLKDKLLSNTTKRSFENRIKNFGKWIIDNHPEKTSITEIDKRLVMDFLNEMLGRTSPRNRNNYRTDLSSLFQALEDDDIIEANFIKKIPVLKSIPKRNKAYSPEVQEEIFEYLEKHDKDLLLFIKFISYNFLRPIEVCRLKVGDLDIKHKKVNFQAKNSPLKTKIIPDIMIEEIPDLSKMKKGMWLFTPEGIGGDWNTELENRRDYFTKRFKRTVKDKFGLGPEFGLYSFRHTFITKLYRQIRKTATPFEAKSHLMQITGHTSMKALEKYLREIDAELPEDYSELIKP